MDEAKNIEIIEDNSNLFMIPSKKGDRVATFQKMARVKSWIIEREWRKIAGMTQATGLFLY